MTEVSIYTEHRMAEGESLGPLPWRRDSYSSFRYVFYISIRRVLCYAGRQGARVWLARYSPPDANPRKWTGGPKTPFFVLPRGRGSTGGLKPPAGTATGAFSPCPDGFRSIYPYRGLLCHFAKPRVSTIFMSLGADGPMGGKHLYS